MIGKLKVKFWELQAQSEGLFLQFWVLPESYFAARRLAQACRIRQEEGKESYSLSLDEAKQKRSLDQNAYMWVLLDRIAATLRSSKDEVYLEMLERYGKFTHIAVKPEAVAAVKREWRTCRELGPVTVNGKPAVQLQCYFGSSTYSMEEMSRLLAGIISEAQELGIDVEGAKMEVV